MTVFCGTPQWRIELPRSWCAQHGPNNVAVYHPDGVGALQFSSYRKPQGLVTDVDLKEMATGSEMNPVRHGEFEGFKQEQEDGDTWWLRWFLRADRFAVFVTYNCKVTERGREQNQIEKILDSLTCPAIKAMAEQKVAPDCGGST